MASTVEKTKKDSKSCWYMVEDDQGTPVPNLSKDVVEKVIEYCKKHELDEHVEEESFKKWDAEFVKVDHDTLIDLIFAAHYLNITSLQDLTSRTVLDKMKMCNLTRRDNQPIGIPLESLLLNVVVFSNNDAVETQNT